jgi:hypothetical protein
MISRAQKSERRGLHLRDRAKDIFAFNGRANAIDVARKKSHAERSLEILYAPAKGINRLAARFRRASETSRPRDLEEDTRRLPIRRSSGDGSHGLFRFRNTPFVYSPHT